MTSVHLPGMRSGAGIAEWGRKTPAEMIEMIRSYAASNKADAERILAAADDDFKVVTYVGAHVQKNRETLQEGMTIPKP